MMHLINVKLVKVDRITASGKAEVGHGGGGGGGVMIPEPLMQGQLCQSCYTSNGLWLVCNMCILVNKQV